MPTRSKAIPVSTTEDDLPYPLDDRLLRLRLQRHRTARTLRLRLSADGESLVLSLPLRYPRARALEFAAGQASWVQARLAGLPPRVPFADGAELPLFGAPHRVRSRPDGRRGVWREATEIHVSGEPEFLPRRLRDWLQREALSQFSALTREKADLLEGGRPLRRVRVRDTVSRWGSCTAAGDISFSWRLVFAPHEIVDYVVAHETAHLLPLDHSSAFWRCVEGLTPHRPRAQAWLRENGRQLLRYG